MSGLDEDRTDLPQPVLDYDVKSQTGPPPSPPGRNVSRRESRVGRLEDGG